MPKEFKVNIEQKTITNKNYRRVLYTSDHNQMQLVIMSIPPNEDIPQETHSETDQFIRVEKGKGFARIGLKKKQYFLKDGDAIVIPANTVHYIKNTSDTEPLKLYTIYSPGVHSNKLVQKKKEQS